MKQLGIINPRNIPIDEGEKYKVRTGEIGFTVEYWKEDDEKQISYCYKARVLGQKGKPDLTESEKARGFSLLWVSYTKAIELLVQSKSTQFEGEYIVPRELIFLREAGVH